MNSANHKSISGALPCGAKYCSHELLTGIVPDETACIVCLGNRHWHHHVKPQRISAGDNMIDATFPSPIRRQSFTHPAC